MRIPPFAAAFVLPLAGGLAHAASIASPWDGRPQWWLQLLSVALLAFVVRQSPSIRGAALAGLVFATSSLAATFWWLFISMHTYGGLPAIMAAAAVLLLAMFLALYYSLACGVFKAVQRGGVIDALFFASAWLGAELMRASWFTGFPWGSGGYAHVDGPLAVLAPWIGVYGIGFVAAWIGHEVAALVRGPRAWQHGAVVALVACLLLVLDVMPLSAQSVSTPSARLSVTLLQGNIPQDEKFEAGTGIPVALGWYKQQLEAARTNLVVTPETAIPLLPNQLVPGYLRDIGGRFAAGTQAALVGIPLGNHEEGYTNSVIGLKPDSPVYRYDKHHLVPFGEFIPPLFKWFTRMMNIPLGDFNRGAVAQDSFVWQGQRLAPNICYEDLFGEELGARFLDEGKAPTIFVNMSNIAWFGNSIAIDQHLQASRMRAIEFARPMLRATNTGATVIIDASGKVTAALPRHTRGALVGEVAGGHGITPYAWWMARFGLWPFWVLVLLVLGFPSVTASLRKTRLS